MTYADHTANYRRFQAALVCEQCHALHENCPHHRRGLRAALRAFWQRWANKRAQREIVMLRRQIAALNAQLSEAEGRLDSEIRLPCNAHTGQASGEGMTMEPCRNCLDTYARKDKPNAAREPHPCVFKQELYNDNQPCMCCEDCTHDCAMEV